MHSEPPYILQHEATSPFLHNLLHTTHVTSLINRDPSQIVKYWKTRPKLMASLYSLHRQREPGLLTDAIYWKATRGTNPL